MYTGYNNTVLNRKLYNVIFMGYDQCNTSNICRFTLIGTHSDLDCLSLTLTCFF